MTDYLKDGFNRFFKKQETISSKEQMEDVSSLRISKPSSSVGSFGKIVSVDGRITIDWDNAKITISDGVRDRVIIGYIREENKYGVRVVDSTGGSVVDNTA